MRRQRRFQIYFVEHFNFLYRSLNRQQIRSSFQPWICIAAVCAEHLKPLKMWRYVIETRRGLVCNVQLMRRMNYIPAWKSDRLSWMIPPSVVVSLANSDHTDYSGCFATGLDSFLQNLVLMLLISSQKIMTSVYPECQDTLMKLKTPPFKGQSAYLFSHTSFSFFPRNFHRQNSLGYDSVTFILGINRLTKSSA